MDFLIYKNNLYKSNEAEISKQIKTNQEAEKFKNKNWNNDLYLSLKFIYKKNDLNTVKVIFCDLVGCSIEIYNFILLKSSFKNVL